MKIGVLGGTFDPVHHGHLAIAEAARVRLALGEVIFIPAGRPWMKLGNHLSSAAHRVRMLELALAGRDGFRLSKLEIERPGPSYTMDTLAELRAALGVGAELYFIIGQDKLAELPQWHEPARLLELCMLVAAPRPGVLPPDLTALEARLPGLSRRVILLDGPQLDISASTVRERVRDGKDITALVPGPVAGYIREQGLYNG